MLKYIVESLWLQTHFIIHGNSGVMSITLAKQIVYLIKGYFDIFT
jgi:hypothetical protein